MKWLRQIFGSGKNPVEQPQEHPPRPADWCKTFADLSREMEEGQRKSIGQPEVNWARDYERSLIPKEARFPKQGDVYKAVRDLEVTFMTSWSAPYTGGGTTMIYEGERFWVDSDPGEEKALGTYALAVEYDQLEKRIVEAAERSNPKYGGFYFYFDTVVLNKDFALVETDYRKERKPDVDSKQV